MPKLSGKKLSILIKLFTLLFVFSLVAFLISLKIQGQTKAQAECTYSVPGNFNTIQAAANAVQPGETICVRAGTYHEQINVQNSGSSGNYITFQSYPGEKVVIGGSGNVFYLNNKSYIRIKGFEIRNGTNGIFVTGNSNNNIIQDNYITNNGSTGVFLYGSSGKPANNRITSNTITSNGYQNNNFPAAVFIDNSDGNIIENNNILDNAHTAISVDRDCSNNIVQDNYVSGNSAWKNSMDRAAISFWRISGPGNIVRRNIVTGQISGGYEGDMYFGSGIIIDFGGGVRVENNIIYDNTGFGIDLYNSSNNLVYHNTVYSNKESSYGRTGSWVAEIRGEGGSNNIIRNNIAYSDTNAPPLNAGGANADHNLLYQEGDQGNNPLFVNPPNDFHLQANSPAINTGTDVGVYDDFDGNPRPQGGGYDIGAYEYTGGVIPTSTSTPTPSSSPGVSPSPTPTPGSVSLPLRINSAGQDYTDKEGNLWLADKAYSPGSWGHLGGETLNRWDENPNLDIAGTEDDVLYVSERYAMSGYQLDLPNGSYNIILHFAETFSGITGPGQRVFDVVIEGQTVLDDFDPYAEAGFATVITKTITNTSVTDGQLNITFTANLENPEINAIEVLSSSSLTPSPTPQDCSHKPQGDANCDGSITGLDYSLWLNSQCRSSSTQSCADTRADFNGDGNVDDGDYEIWYGNRA